MDARFHPAIAAIKAGDLDAIHAAFEELGEALGIIADDDGVAQETRTQLENLGARLIAFPHPFSFSHKVNVGVLHARGDYLLLLNDDVEVLPEGWNGMTAIVGAGDFNGDGHPDLVARDGTGRLWLFPGNGTGGFLATRLIGSGWSAMSAIIATADLST